jgi:hypothetical protein
MMPDVKFGQLLQEFMVQLTVPELLDVSSIYGMVLNNHEDLIALAVAYKKPLAQVYWECKRAQQLISERVRQLQKLPYAERDSRVA